MTAPPNAISQGSNGAGGVAFMGKSAAKAEPVIAHRVANTAIFFIGSPITVAPASERQDGGPIKELQSVAGYFDYEAKEVIRCTFSMRVWNHILRLLYGDNSFSGDKCWITARSRTPITRESARPITAKGRSERALRPFNQGE